MVQSFAVGLLSEFGVWGSFVGPKSKRRKAKAERRSQGAEEKHTKAHLLRLVGRRWIETRGLRAQCLERMETLTLGQKLLMTISSALLVLP